MPRRVRKWDGGYVRKDERGREVYTIRRMINGKRYDVSTRAHTERAALEQLKRFEADPEGYDARGVLRPDPIYLDKKLSETFFAYSREEKKNSRGWVAEQRALLADWAEDLRGVDLRRGAVRGHLLPPPQEVTSPGHPIRGVEDVSSWPRARDTGLPPYTD